MRLGIIGAMDIEVQMLKKKMELLGTRVVSEMHFYIGRLEGVPVVVVQSGIGKVNAAVCAQTLCREFGVTHIINTGIAGALNPHLDIGDIVVSCGAVHHDFDCTAFGYGNCRIPGMPTVFEADRELGEMAFYAAYSIHPGCVVTGTIASGDQFVSSDALKATIHDKTLEFCTGAMCAEMEGAAIAQVAYLNDVPFVILRTISDKAGEGAVMLYEEFEIQTAERSAQVVLELAKLMKGDK